MKNNIVWIFLAIWVVLVTPFDAAAQTDSIEGAGNYVIGRISSKQLHVPLANQTWETRLTLYRLGPGAREWINATDCNMGVGCTDSNGQFFIAADYQNRSLQPGTYVVEVTAKLHLVRRKQFTLTTSAEINLELDLVPAYAQVLQSTTHIPAAGGKIRAKIRLFNYRSTDKTVAVDSTVSGPGLTSEWTSYQIRRIARLTEQMTYYDTIVEVDIDRRLPNHAMYCMSIKVGKKDQPIEQYHETWVCATKR